MPDLPLIEGGPTQSVNQNAATSLDISFGAPSTINTLSGWTELTPATTYDAAWVLVETRCQNAGSQLVDIGIGPAGSEVALIPQLLAESNSNTGDPGMSYLFPIGIPIGSRLAARGQMNVGSGSFFVSATLIADGLFAPDTPQRATSYGALTASSRGTSVDPGGTFANTKGAWTQLTAATTAPLAWMCVMFGANGNANLTANTQWLVDIGIGASGSEQIIAADLALFGGTNSDVPRPQSVCLPVSVPSGVRLAARCACNVTTNGQRQLDVSVIGVG